jgi:hypothetical protein
LVNPFSCVAYIKSWIIAMSQVRTLDSLRETKSNIYD